MTLSLQTLNRSLVLTYSAAYSGTAAAFKGIRTVKWALAIGARGISLKRYD